MPDTQLVVFISYKHADYSTKVARKLYGMPCLSSHSIDLKVFVEQTL